MVSLTMNAKQNLLLTGRPGCGKTTIVRRFVEGYSGRVGGFYTEEIRKGGQRVGFRIVTLDGRTGILAHQSVKSPYRVSKYGVKIEDIDGIAVPALLAAVGTADLIVIDELGRMELYSERFRQAALNALDSPCALLGVIQDRRHPFLDAVRSRGDTTILRVTAGNRDRLPDRLREWASP